MFLVSPRLGSAGVRYRMHLRLPVNPSPLCNPNLLTCGFNNLAGRGQNGSKTIWTKGKRYAKRKYKTALTSPNGARALGLVCSVFWQSQTRTMLGLIKNSIGAWFFTPASAELLPLSYFSVVSTRTHLNVIRDSQASWWWPLTLLAPYTRASMFPIGQGAVPKFVKAPGSTALVLTPHLWQKWALIVLPSGQLFICANSPHVLLGGVAPIDRNGAFYPTAGAQRRRGFSPQVRGVAKNPNDHPHGGRTKSVKYPRTPWGRTTKFPRPPRPKLKLKALSKRRVSTPAAPTGV